MVGLFGKPPQPAPGPGDLAQDEMRRKLIAAAAANYDPNAHNGSYQAALAANVWNNNNNNNNTTPRRAIELGEEMITKLADMLDAMEEMHKLIVPPGHKDTFDKLAQAVRQQRDTARRIVELRNERTKHQAALHKTEGELSVIGESEPSYVRL